MGLRYWWAFSSFRERGLLSRCGARASHCGGFPWIGARALGHTGFSSCRSQALEHKLNNYDKLLCTTCGIFPDQGSNPCLLHWQVGGLPRSHRGSAWIGCVLLPFFLKTFYHTFMYALTLMFYFRGFWAFLAFWNLPLLFFTQFYVSKIHLSYLSVAGGHLFFSI